MQTDAAITPLIVIRPEAAARRRSWVVAIGAPHISALTAIVLVAALLRLWGLDREGYWGDEYVQTQLYPLPLHYTLWYGLTQHGFGPPDFVIGWLAHRISPSEWMCRLPAALWGVVAVTGCYFLVARLASRSAGLVAATLLALCRMNIVMSQEARPYSICLAFIVLTLLAFLYAWESPSNRRVALYALVALTCTLTRSFIPTMYVATIGLVLTVALLLRSRRKLDVHPPTQDKGDRSTVLDTSKSALRRLWVATAVVGLLVLPMLLFLYQRSPYTPGAKAFMPNSYEVSTNVLVRAADHATVAAVALFKDFGPAVVACFFVGVWAVLRPDRRTPLNPPLARGEESQQGLPETAPVFEDRQPISPRACVFAVLLVVGPVLILMYALIGGVHAFYERYSFFLLPTVCVLTAIGVAKIQEIPRRIKTRRPTTRRAFEVALVLVVLAWPAAQAYSETQSFRRRDWRGCAEFLVTRTGPEDVIMVVSSVPFGRVQHRFYGKYEWPVEQRPLAEAAWTLAASDAHFQRLREKTGRCVAVIAYPVGPQSGDAYRRHGLTTPPTGYELKKFRGLDVLSPTTTYDSIAGAVEIICRDLSSLDWEHPSTRAVTLALQSRITALLGRTDESYALYDEAAAIVPPAQRAYFEHATQSWPAANQASAEVPEQDQTGQGV